MSVIQRQLIIGFVFVLAILFAFPANAGLKEFSKKWGMRGLGVAGSFVLHEACHLATGAMFGAKISAHNDPGALFLPQLEFRGLKSRQDRAVAISGLACTAISAEFIMGRKLHKRNDFAWGMLATHAVNAGSYAFSSGGDAEYWTWAGGSRNDWRIPFASHSARSGAVLLWDEPYFVRLRGGEEN